jgi:hypothetical protein
VRRAPKGSLKKSLRTPQKLKKAMINRYFESFGDSKELLLKSSLAGVRG